jgi:membrane-bound serine protease (ClpP class)
MRVLLAFLLSLSALVAGEPSPAPFPRATKKVYVIPVRDDIMPPLVYVIRRGVKEAMENNADLLVLDMETNGGRVDTTREIIDIIEKFRGDTVTFVNKNAFSAGAFIAVGTKKIYMAPGSVIGAAAPIMLSPAGDGVEKMSDTFEKKMTSAVAAQVRATAVRNGHNPAVVEAMINKNKGLTIDGEVIVKEGELLTLTDQEAARKYGQPPKPLLSAGTVDDLDALLAQLDYAEAARIDIKPTGTEKLGTWLNTIAPLLLILGVIGLYIEFKTPGFGLPGILGITAFALYFMAGYVSGFSGWAWMIVFLVGLGLVVVEFFIYPGTVVIGMIGAVLMLGSIIMALVDVYPAAPPSVPSPGPVSLPGLPQLPGFDGFQHSMNNLILAVLGSAVGVWIASRFLPKTSVYRAIISQSASGVGTETALAQQRSIILGAEGVALSNLRPGGKAQFGDKILDVITQGDLVAKGVRVRVIGFSAAEAVVEVIR